MLQPSGPEPRCDAHVDPQLSFLVQEYPGRGLVRLPLTYLGHLERIKTELPAIIREFFGEAAADRIQGELRGDTLHGRQHETPTALESHGLHNFRVDQMREFKFTPSDIACPRTLHLLQKAFHIDYECLGYHNASLPLRPPSSCSQS